MMKGREFLSSPASPTERRSDLDALRASAMMLGIVYHGALSLALGFPWFVQDPSANGAMYVFQSWVHGFRMPLFFIISGFFTAMLWKKRGAGALVSHRFRRVFLPCLVGAIAHNRTGRPGHNRRCIGLDFGWPGLPARGL